MLTISNDAFLALSDDVRRRVSQNIANLIAQANPALAAQMTPAELFARTHAGTGIASRYNLASRRDVTLLCLAHALFGSDFLVQQRFAWVVPVLEEAPADPDTRMYRVHHGLSDMGAIA